MVTPQITQHSVVSALYACPLSDEAVRNARARDLARYASHLYANTPAKMLEELEQGVSLAAKKGGAVLDLQRYTLASRRAPEILAALSLLEDPPRST